MKILYRVDRPDLSEAVLAALQEKGMKQAELARLLGMTRQYFWKVMKGQRAIGLEKVRQIEEILGINLEVGDG